MNWLGLLVSAGIGAWNMDAARKERHKQEHRAALSNAIWSGQLKSLARDLAVIFGCAAAVVLVGKTFTRAVG